MDNIPLWVAFGHGLIFAVVFKLSHNPTIRRHQQTIQPLLLLFAGSYALFWLLWANDWYGFICTLAFIFILLSVKKSRLFFLIMFLVICYVEQIGTATGCWYWPDVALGTLAWLPSGNPPSGIAVFYFLFDAAVFYVYLHVLHPRVKTRYQAIMAS
jgi:hypothetical protein